jgi:hypothetical protein
VLEATRAKFFGHVKGLDTKRVKRMVKGLKYKEEDMSHDPQQYGTARHWKLSRARRRTGITSKRKDCWNVEHIGDFLSIDQ